MGTKNTNAQVEPTVPCASNLDELHSEYKQYKLLRKKEEMDTMCDAGTSAYLISSAWLQKYEKFIMYEQFEQNSGFAPTDDHFETKHPGVIKNKDELCEVDRDGANLYGTGTIKGLEREYIDQYLDGKKKF